MKKIVLLALCSYSLVVAAHSQALTVEKSMPKAEDNVKYYQYSNQQQLLEKGHIIHRAFEFPTQIVRYKADVSAAKLYCEDVTAKVDEIFTNKITSDKFFYNTLVACGYDRKTHYAKALTINSYFDPKVEAGVDYLQAYKLQYNGSDLFGTPFNIEEAQGLIVSLNIAVGKKNDPNDFSLIRVRQDRANYFYPSNAKMLEVMVRDIKQRFHNHDPEMILPFLNDWFYPHAGRIYTSALHYANYIELQPERIFLMESEPRTFTSRLRFYFAKACYKFPNKHCL